MDSDLEPWMLELIKTIKAEDKIELEEAYGVEFDPDSLPLSCHIITSFCDDLKEASNHDRELQMKEHIVKILDAACRRVTCNLHKVVEEDGLDIEYLLHRACVELAEIRKEKEHVCSELWLTRVRKEYDDLMDTWHKFEKKWKPLLLSQSLTRFKEIGMLKQVHKELASYLRDEKAVEEVEAATMMFQQFNDLRAKIELSIDEELKQILTVGERDIMEAARTILSIPALLPSKFFKPNSQDLETRLAKRLFGQEHGIRAITSALSGPHSGKGPIRSFLFICGSESGGEELTKALAEQLFYDEEQMIEFDLEKNTKDDSVMDLNVRQIELELSEYVELNKDKKSDFRGELIDAVKKMPSTILLLRNVDKACASVIDFLVEILRNGKIEDEKGKMVDFSKTLIIMASNVLYDSVNLTRHWKCNCALMPGKLFLKEKMEDHDCQYLSLLKHAKQHFKPELLDIIDNMIVFRQLIHSEFRALLRLRIRKLVNSIGGGRIIVYPSEAALNIIESAIESGDECTKTYLEQNVVPKLLEICSQSRRVRSIVYMDTLVGINDLSYRVEMGGSLAGDQEFGQFLAYLCEFWNMYDRDILWLRDINGLRKTLQFIDRTNNNGDPQPLEPLVYKIRKLLASENSVNSMPMNLQMMGFSSSGSLGRSDQFKKRANEMEDLQLKLCTGLVAKHYVFSVVAKAILSCIKPKVMANNSHPMTALLLGLASNGKANLRRDLTKVLDDENNETAKMLVQINLSQCSNYYEFFKLIYDGHNQHSFGYPETVGMRPGSVLLIDQVEKAPMSVFSGLIFLLDYRILTDHHRSCTIDLSDTVIIMVSDLGNRDFIVEMFEDAVERERKLNALMEDLNINRNCQRPDSSVSEYSKQPDWSRFRFELLNRIDEVVFFNPCVGNQMTSFARLSMKDGPHLKNGSPQGGLSNAFRGLFDESNFKREPLSIISVARSVELLLTGLLTKD